MRTRASWQGNFKLPKTPPHSHYMAVHGRQDGTISASSLHQLASGKGRFHRAWHDAQIDDLHNILVLLLRMQ